MDRNSNETCDWGIRFHSRALFALVWSVVSFNPVITLAILVILEIYCIIFQQSLHSVCQRAEVSCFLCCNKRNRRRLHLGSMVLNIKSLVASVQRSLQQGLSWRTTPIVAHFPQSRNSQLWVQASRILKSPLGAHLPPYSHGPIQIQNCVSTSIKQLPLLSGVPISYGPSATYKKYILNLLKADSAL